MVFKISEFAQLSGTTAIQLRHYDDIGLFSPVWVDPENSYRFYSAAQLPELHRIIALRDIGLPLSEIASLIEEGEDLRGALAEQRRRLVAERRTLDRRLAALDIRVDLTDETQLPDVVVRNLAPELVASIRVRLEPHEELAPLFDELEIYVRDVKARASRPPGSLVRETDGSAVRDIEIYVPLTHSIDAHGRIRIARLPAAQVATAIHRGGYETLSDSRAALDRWVRTAGLRTAGPARIVYLQFGAPSRLRLPGAFVTEAAAEFVTEIRQPIQAG